MTFSWQVLQQSFKVAGEFRISRGARSQVSALQLKISYGDYKGIAECVPYARYGESLASSAEEINKALSQFNDLPTRQ